MQALGTQKKQGSIVEAISQAILSGQIPAGTEMTQKELAESLGVSRMPVREALILLEYQGLIHRLPNNHVQVADLTEDYLTHLFSLCAGLEADLLMRQPEIIKNNDVTPQSLLGSNDAELTFHHTLTSRCPYPLQKKTLETMVQIYIPYALDSPVYERTAGMTRINEIKKALSDKLPTHGVPDSFSHEPSDQSLSSAVSPASSIPALLDTYFKALCDAAIHERRSLICSD